MLFNLLKITCIGLLIGYVTSIPVGPVGTLVIRDTLEKNAKSAFLFGLGASVSDLLYGTLVTYNLSAFRTFFMKYELLLQFIGIVFILFLSIRSFIVARSKKELFHDISKKRRGRNFILAFTINTTNPAVILLFSFFFVLFSVEKLISGGVSMRIAFLFSIFFGSLLWWNTTIYLVSFLQKKIRKDILPLIHKLSGLVLSMFAILIFFSILWKLFFSSSFASLLI